MPSFPDSPRVLHALICFCLLRRDGAGVARRRSSTSSAGGSSPRSPAGTILTCHSLSNKRSVQSSQVCCAGSGSDGGPRRSTDSGRRSEHSDAGLQPQQAEQERSRSPPLERTNSTESVLLAPRGKVTHLEPRYPFSQYVPGACLTTATLFVLRKPSMPSGLCHVACQGQTDYSHSLEWGPETDVALCSCAGWQF